MDVVDMNKLPDVVVERNLSDMDVNKDLADPSENITMYDDGKYLFKTSSGEFDIDRFNRYYEQYRERRKKEMYKRMKERLDILNKTPPIIPIYDYSIGQILIGMKDSIVGVSNELLNWNYNQQVSVKADEDNVAVENKSEIKVQWDILTKDNRLFFIGLVLVIIAFVIYFLMIFGSMEC